MPLEENQFNHPYSPYSIQHDFMTALYETLESKKIGIFESPTGTGKTLSLICASMTWLRHHKGRRFKALLDDLKPEEGEPQWVINSLREMREQEYENRLIEWEKRLRQVKRDIQLEVEVYAKKARLERKENSKSDDQHLPDDYHSDDEEKHHDENGLSSASLALLNQLGAGYDRYNTGSSKERARPQIFFASRTHAQLSQFVGQLKLTSFPPSVPTASVSEESTKQISLGSRKQLCIHPKVSKLHSVSHINDACLDMQREIYKRCPYWRSKNNPEHASDLEQFKMASLSDLHDIEDIASLGKQMSVCPYYGIRNAVDSSEIITLPYQILLQKSARESLSIDLTDSIVIIDEAHNLLDTISSMHSMAVCQAEVQDSLSGLQIYTDKFSKRLNGSNRIYLAQITKAVSALEKFLSVSTVKKFKVGQHISQSEIFLGGTGDSINMYRLEKYLKRSKLAFKIDSYIESLRNESKNDFQSIERAQRFLLSKVVSFLLAINNPSSEGKLFFGYNTKTKEPQLEYLLLDPSKVFKEIVNQARCIILAGGTMEPVGDYLNYLFPYVERDKIQLFSCGHIIPQENLGVTVVRAGPTNQEMHFSFVNRDNKDMIVDLGRAVLNILSIAPNGVVVFLPSYQFLGMTVELWKTGGMLDRMDKKKKVFYEPRQASEVDVVLRDYSDSCTSGAVLFCVVGGKLSEGINFSDHLARAVIMVGLPFPNFFSADMVAKREYIEHNVMEAGGTKEDALNAAKDYYENLCLRAVNQSIGRAIRHKADYAMVYLVDKRYTEERIQRKLPNWIRRRVSTKAESFGQVVKLGAQFFRSRDTTVL